MKDNEFILLNVKGGGVINGIDCYMVYFFGFGGVL